MNVSRIARRAGLVCLLFLAPFAVSAASLKLTVLPEDARHPRQDLFVRSRRSVNAAQRMEQERRPILRWAIYWKRSICGGGSGALRPDISSME